MDTNPYESPATDVRASTLEGETATIVEGKCLVLPTDAVLPPVCVRTNVPVSDADMVKRTFYWCSPWVALLILISGCLVVIAYFLVRKRFTITYGLTPELRKSYRKWLWIKLLIAAGLFVGMLVAGNVAEVFIVMLVLFVVALVALFIGNAPLSVINHRKGFFWVKGCSDAYLAQVEEAFGSVT